VVIGEIFPLPIRSKGVALSTASNWLWNFAIGYVTPYMVDEDEGNLRAKVFFVWGATCTLCVVFAYFLVPETKGLSLEQVDRMLEETSPRTSAAWVPHAVFADEKTLHDMEVVTQQAAAAVLERQKEATNIVEPTNNQNPSVEGHAGATGEVAVPERARAGEAV
jgi:hypothetical protein